MGAREAHRCCPVEDSRLAHAVTEPLFPLHWPEENKTKKKSQIWFFCENLHKPSFAFHLNLLAFFSRDPLYLSVCFDGAETLRFRTKNSTSARLRSASVLTASIHWQVFTGKRKHIRAPFVAHTEQWSYICVLHLSVSCYRAGGRAVSTRRPFMMRSLILLTNEQECQFKVSRRSQNTENTQYIYRYFFSITQKFFPCCFLK